MRWKNLWELDCFAASLVFASAFDRQETRQLLGERARAHDGCVPVATPTDFEDFALLHGLCHERTPLSAGIQDRLDRTFQDMMREVEAGEPDEIRRLAVALLETGSSRLAGMVWALERADCRALEPVRQWLRSLIMLRGVRGLVFPEVALP